jgi:hypothetical protein
MGFLEFVGGTERDFRECHTEMLEAKMSCIEARDEKIAKSKITDKH